jgi:hypothetical protein
MLGFRILKSLSGIIAGTLGYTAFGRTLIRSASRGGVSERCEVQCAGGIARQYGVRGLDRLQQVAVRGEAVDVRPILVADPERAVTVGHHALDVEHQAVVRARDDREHGVPERETREARLRAARGGGVEPARRPVLALELERRAKVRELEGLLGVGEGEVAGAGVGREHEVDGELAGLVVDRAVSGADLWALLLSIWGGWTYTLNPRSGRARRVPVNTPSFSWNDPRLMVIALPKPPMVSPVDSTKLDGMRPKPTIP